MAQKRYSRLNPAYLAKRHAGMTFMLLALGLLAGLAWRFLVQPTRYHAETEVAVVATPEDKAGEFDWDAKKREWQTLLSDRREWGLIGVNLRHVVKLAVTRDDVFDLGQLPKQLALLEPEETFSASLFANSLLARFGENIRVARADLAGNMDFQSLAVIAADLDPPAGARDWDFSFFQNFSPNKPETAAIVRPGPEDPFFRVFYQMHRALNGGRDAATPGEAWRSAVAEVDARIERESKFSGGGGFGKNAKREILREITAIPYLAANRLYHANGWFGGGDDAQRDAAEWSRRWRDETAIALSRGASPTGVLGVGMTMELKPLGFPRDTAATRVPPLVASTLISFLAAREDLANPSALEAPAGEAVKIVEAVAPATPVMEAVRVQPEPPAEVTYREVIDDIANKQRLSNIAMLTESVRMVTRDRDACLRRLNAAREDENRLSFEAMNARNRADRLRERYDEAVELSEPDYTPKVPAETQRLFTARDAILRRLSELLTYCTEEHPFVKEARRELAAAEAVLATHAPDPGVNKGAEERATRIANLYLEWESASAAADSLEERRRRKAEEVSCLLDETTNLECVISQREIELSGAKLLPVPIKRMEVPVAPAARPPRIEVTEAEVVPAPREEEVVAPMPAPIVGNGLRLVFAGAPAHIELHRTEPGWDALWQGLLGGLLAALLAILLRELFARYFATPAEARRLVQLPVLAALPAYDAKSFRAAAATMKGELTGSRKGLMQFTPTPVELFEPPAEARRGKLYPARRRPKLLAWILGLCLLLLAGLLYYHARGGIARPYVAFTGEMPLPAATVPVWAEEREDTGEWGNLP